MPKQNELICITGIILRTTDQEIIVEIEINDLWYEVVNEWVGPMEFSVSHIVNPAGILPHIPANKR